jgi:hypothetical protein
VEKQQASPGANDANDTNDANDAAPVRPVLPVLPNLPVLSYEKPFLYRYKSDLPRPGPVAKAFWVLCFSAGALFGKFYRPRPVPRLYSGPVRR